MALTELQLPTKNDFYQKVQNAASTMDNLMREWKNIAEFIGFVTAADLDAMAVPAGQVRTDLVNFRTVMNELLDFYEGGTMTRTNVPAEIVDKLRRM